MPKYDLAFDYELLKHLADQAQTLKDELADPRLLGRDILCDVHTFGEGFKDVFQYFLRWLSPFDHAQELLGTLSATYLFVAQKMFEQDAQFASQANTQSAAYKHSVWKMHKDEYDAFQKAAHTTVTVTEYDKNGKPHKVQKTLADPNDPDAPKDPGAEPLGNDYTSSDGYEKHTTHTSFDSEGKMTSTDVTIDDGGGFTYHEHTDFGEYGSHTTTVTHTDGSKTVITVHGNSDGSGTKEIVDTDKDGKTTGTSSYTGSGVSGDNPQWTNNDPTADDDDDGDNAEGTQHSNTGVGSQA